MILCLLVCHRWLLCLLRIVSTTSLDYGVRFRPHDYQSIATPPLAAEGESALARAYLHKGSIGHINSVRRQSSMIATYLLGYSF